MKKIITTKLQCAFAVCVVSGCTWVEPTDRANQVALISASDAVSCTKIGSTTSKVLDKIGFIDRSKTKQNEELTTLAKNEAARMGGNAISTDGVINDGRQTFLVYNCEKN